MRSDLGGVGFMTNKAESQSVHQLVHRLEHSLVMGTQVSAMARSLKYTLLLRGMYEQVMVV